MTYRLYIGANNATKKLETDKIEAIVSSNHEGFTVERAKGFWKGKAEDTAIVTIQDVKEAIYPTILRLKSELGQEAIGYQIVPEMKFA